MYRSFLLRVWRQRDGAVRASVEDVDTREVDTFDDVRQLCEWLDNRVDDAGPTDRGWGDQRLPRR